MSAFQAVQACPTLTKPQASRAIGFPLQPFRGSFLPTIPASLTALAQVSPLNHGSGAAGPHNLPYHERTSKLTGLLVVSEHQRSPEFFTKVQHFYKNICCSGCCMPLLSMVVFCFINFVKLYSLFFGGQSISKLLSLLQWKLLCFIQCRSQTFIFVILGDVSSVST